jgi:long-chain acyl-CoA synthetase
MIFEAYAMTETASSFTIQNKKDYDFESVGRVLDNMDVKIINKDRNGIGEIVAKGDCIFLGYYKNEIETKKSFTKDGYFITGDLGYLKNDLLYITGRNKKILTTNNGENIFIDEIIKKIKDINSNLDIKLFIQDDKLCAKIYSLKLTEDEIKIIIDKYNKNCTKFNRITKIKIIKEVNQKLM